jgi:hypothetical protein
MTDLVRRCVPGFIFLDGLLVWYDLHAYWFRGSFRLQALGAVLLAYWMLFGIAVYVRHKERQWEAEDCCQRASSSPAELPQDRAALPCGDSKA